MMAKARRHAVVVLAAFIAVSPALAKPITVPVAAAKAWCSERSIPIVESATDAAVEEEVDKAKEAGASELDQQLFKQGIFYSGMPFVTSPRKVTVAAPALPRTTPTPASPSPALPPPPQNYVLDTCVLIGAETTPPPATIKLLALPAANYSALACGALSADDCLTVLRKEMVERFGLAKEDEMTASPIIEVQAADPVTATSIAVAYSTARERATWKALSLIASGATGLEIGNIAERPLAIDAAAGVQVSGMPGAGRKVFMIKEPS